MKNKTIRTVSLVLVAALLVAIPASTQMLKSQTDTDDGSSSLGLVLLVNRLELTEDQMMALQDLINGVVDMNDEMDAARAAFEDEMIAFNGTSEELDKALATFQDAQSARKDALDAAIADAVDRAEELLSIKQGQVLQDAFPQLARLTAFAGTSGTSAETDSDFGATHGRTSTGANTGGLMMMRERMGSADASSRRLEQLQQRAAQMHSADSDEATEDGTQAQRLRQRMTALKVDQESDTSSAILGVGRRMAGKARLMEIAKNLGEILELKLQALQ